MPSPVLLALFGLPIAGALAVPFMPKSDNAVIARIWALLVMLGVLVLSAGIFACFGTTCLDPKLLDLNLPWIASSPITVWWSRTWLRTDPSELCVSGRGAALATAWETASPREPGREGARPREAATGGRGGQSQPPRPQALRCRCRL